MKRISVLVLMVLAGLCISAKGCESGDGGGVNPVVENVSSYKPNLPSVPTIPKPSVPETYSDSTYSVYGLRRNMTKTIDTQVTVTAYIAKIYQKPECPEDQTCHTIMPHLFLADDSNEQIERRYLRLVGYAQSFREMEDEKFNDEQGKVRELPEGVYLPPVIWNWQQGRKYKISGVFSRQSGSGFMDTDGLLEYGSHECLDCPDDDSKEE